MADSGRPRNSDRYSHHPDRRRPRADSRSRSRSRSRSPPPPRQHSARSQVPPHSPQSHSRPRSRPQDPHPPSARPRHRPFSPSSIDPFPAAVPAPPKEKPNFKPTGLLAREANRIAGTDVILKYHEPVDAAKPGRADWRLFSFPGRGRKGDDDDGGGGDDDNRGGSSEDIPPIALSSRSFWLFGRERRAVAVQLSHESVDDQHAVIQFRRRTKPAVPEAEAEAEPNGALKNTTQIKPYVVDLESERGTRLNGKKIPTGRFVELKKGDILQFGKDRREWVLVRTDGPR